MNTEIQNLIGSPKLDIFKWAHKQMDAPFYAADGDLILVAKSPPGIVAYLDYKGSGEGITYTEQLLYDIWVETNPVFIVRGDPKYGPFEVSRYIKGGSTVFACNLKDWNEFRSWEAEQRRLYTRSPKR